MNMPVSFLIVKKWNAIPTEQSQNYKWNQNSTYIQNPPYFDALGDDLSIKPLKDLKVLAKIWRYGYNRPYFSSG